MALTSYHFDLGNSNTGPIGYCARVEATSRRAAVTRLKELLKEQLDGLNAHNVYGDGKHGEGKQSEYVEVYFNIGAVTAVAIDDEEPAS